MKYTLMSDLHLDFPQPRLPILSGLVIVAGDLANTLAGAQALAKWKNVFVVDGNHDHYANIKQGRSIEENEHRFYEILDQKQVVNVDETYTIIGTNGWYRVEDPDHWNGYMTDGERVGDYKQVNDKALNEAIWMYEQLMQLDPDRKAIVVTHTAPCEESLDPRFEGSSGNQYYWNPWMRKVMRDMHSRIAVWHHGHTHAAVDVVVDDVHIRTNPRGYPGENPRWKPLEVVLP